MPREKKYEKYSEECARFMLETFCHTDQWISRDILISICGEKGFLGEPGDNPEDYKNISRFYNAIRILKKDSFVITERDDDHVVIKNGHACKGTRMKYKFLDNEVVKEPYKFPFDYVDNTKIAPKDRAVELISEALVLWNQFYEKFFELRNVMLDRCHEK